MMSIMPTWSVANDHVVIGSNRELCDMGVKQLVSKGPDTKSLLDTDGYKKAAAGLPKGLVSLVYTDSRVQLDQTMMQLQQVWPMLTMAAMQEGVKLPVMLPSITEISKDLSPSCGYWYVSPEGLRWHYRGSGIEPSQMSVGGAALGVGILMPALARVRQLSYRMTSGTNLSSIGKACLIYANDYDDKLPPDLQTLVDKAELPPKCLESKRKPKDFDGPSYIYISGQTIAMYPGNIVAYENPAFCQDGINVLFLDSHVEFMKPADLPARVGGDLRKTRQTDARGQIQRGDEGQAAGAEARGTVTRAGESTDPDDWGRDFVSELTPNSGKPFVVRGLGRDGRRGGSGYDADVPPTDPPIRPMDWPTE